MTFTDIGSTAGRPVSNRFATSTWTLNPEADLLNALCSNNDATFPSFRWLPRKNRKDLMAACHQAFLVVKDYAEILLFQKLTDAEKGVLLTIQRKTLRYNKLMEMIGRKAFYQGHVDLDGSLKLNKYENAMLPPGVSNCSAVSKGVNGLLSKNLISRMESHSDLDLTVYAAGPLQVIIPRFVQVAYTEFLHQAEGLVPNAEGIANAFVNEVLQRFEDFIQKSGLEWEV